jgi:hypothetical protein
LRESIGLGREAPLEPLTAEHEIIKKNPYRGANQEVVVEVVAKEEASEEA